MGPTDRVVPWAANHYGAAPVVGQLVVGLLFFGVPDFGVLARCWLVSCAVFWLAAGLVAAVSRGRPGRAGRWFVTFGWVVLASAGVYILLGSP